MPKRALELLTESMFYVLMAFMRGPMCGIDVMDTVERITEGRVRLGPATLYTILAKFEQVRYIAETEVDGRRRTYEITEKGRQAYEDELARLWHCVADAEKEERSHV